MSRPKQTIYDWVFEPEADESDERCQARFHDSDDPKRQCVCPLGHTGSHYCYPGGSTLRECMPIMWYNKAPIRFKVDSE